MLVNNFTVYNISQLSQNYLKTGKGGDEQTFGNTKIYYNFCYDLSHIES